MAESQQNAVASNARDKPRQGQSDEVPVFDWKHFNDFIDGDIQLERKLIGAFLRTAQVDIQSLVQCYLSNDHAQWMDVAHKLCGSASSIGATRLAQYCDQGQTLSAPDRVAEVERLHPLIIAQFCEVRAALKEKLPHIV